MTDTLILHHLEYSQSFRVLWMLEELQAPYELVVYDRDTRTMAAPDEYKALSPLGTAPVMTCGDLALAESSAIMEFILDRTPDQNLRPGPESPDRTRYLFWWHAAQGSMMPLQLMKTVTTISQKRLPLFMKPFVKLYIKGLDELFIQPRMKRILGMAEIDLSTAPWFGGQQLSAADFLIAYNMIVGAERDMIAEADYPRCMEWVTRMKALPSFARATEKDGRESMALTY
jgi:glutathione S-transferase